MGSKSSTRLRSSGRRSTWKCRRKSIQTIQTRGVEEGPDHLFGKTLEQEERIEAREAELEHISAQAELGTQDGREKRTRDIAAGAER